MIGIDCFEVLALTAVSGLAPIIGAQLSSFVLICAYSVGCVVALGFVLMAAWRKRAG
jgi:hypothetical protein